jgi:hypothetical protein
MSATGGLRTLAPDSCAAELTAPHRRHPGPQESASQGSRMGGTCSAQGEGREVVAPGRERLTRLVLPSYPPPYETSA